MTITPEELVAQIHAENHAALRKIIDQGDAPDELMLALLDQAAMRGFRLGSNFAVSAINAQLALRKAGA
jgi:hypothetical protein